MISLGKHIDNYTTAESGLDDPALSAFLISTILRFRLSPRPGTARGPEFPMASSAERSANGQNRR
jgi:hypothetical protein